MVVNKAVMLAIKLAAKLAIKSRKSQQAMQFLMTYGWALAVVFLVITALVFFDILNVKDKLPDSAGLGPDLLVEDAYVNENSVTLVLRNNLRKKMYDIQVNVTECGNSGALSEQVTLKRGESKKVSIRCLHAKEAGTKFTSLMELNYSTKYGNNTFTQVDDGNIYWRIDRGITLEGIPVWVGNASGIGQDYGYDVAVDADGNVYAVGYTTGNLSFGNGIGFNNSNYGSGDMFLVKYNSKGEVQWVKNSSCTEIDAAYSVDLDSNGNIYVGGLTYGDIEFGDGIGFAWSGNIDGFLVKYDSSGSPQWVKNISGISSEIVQRVYVDKNGYVYITGYSLSDPVYLGDGVSFVNAGNYDIITAKYDSSGTLQWAKNASGTLPNYGWDIAADSSTGVYVVGFSQGTLYFGNGVEFTAASGNDFFLVKYDSDGEAQWVVNTNNSGADSGRSVAIDSEGNIFAGGASRTDIDFGDGASFVNSGNFDFFTVKYDSDGTANWVRNASGSLWDWDEGTDVDSMGNIYSCGYSGSNISFGNDVSFVNSINYDAFVVKITPDGRAEWVVNASGSSSDIAKAVEIDDLNYLYVVGYSASDLDFSYNVSFVNSNTGSTNDFFIVKYR